MGSPSPDRADSPPGSLTPDELLTTTRAVRRRLDLDRPVPLDLIRECVEVAVQAPSASNHQGWHFLVVTDTGQRQALGDLYRRAFRIYENLPSAAGNVVFEDSSRSRTQQRVQSSARYLARVIDRCPALVIPCVEGRSDGLSNPFIASMMGSILPATWSFCLAARNRGLGTSWTTLHLAHEREAAELLDIPYEAVSQVALLPVAFTTGRNFKPGPRSDMDQVIHVDRW